MIADGSTSEKSPPREMLHVLTLTPFYPIRGDDAQGCFVAEPLSWLARLGVTNTVRVGAAVLPGQGGGRRQGGSGAQGAFFFASRRLGPVQFGGFSFRQPSA